MDEEIVYKSLSCAHKENQTENEFHHVQLFPDMKTTYNKRRLVIISIPYNEKKCTKVIAINKNYSLIKSNQKSNQLIPLSLNRNMRSSSDYFF